MTYRTVGKALGRVEGPAKVSGQATYAEEMPISAEKLYNALYTRQHTLPLTPQTP